MNESTRKFLLEPSVERIGVEIARHIKSFYILQVAIRIYPYEPQKLFPGSAVKLSFGLEQNSSDGAHPHSTVPM